MSGSKTARPDAATIRFRDGGFSLVLPGTWVQIPLGDHQRAETVIADLVKRRVGRDDRFATVRREAKQQLLDVAAKATAANAIQLALSMEIVPGFPFPASLMFVYREWPAPVAAEDRLDALGRLLPGGEVVDADPGPTLRSWRQITMTPGTEEIRTTKLEYVVAAPDGRRVLHAVADVPVDIDPDLIVVLFDSIIDSLRWRSAPDGSDHNAPA